jgi:hypothetical protein
MPYIVEKLLLKDTIFFQTSLQSDVCIKSYGPPKLQESQFRDSQLGNPMTKWHFSVGPMARHKKYYKGEGDGFPKSGPWWVFWIHGCPCLVYAPKVLQLCTNQLVVWFEQVHVNNWPTCHSIGPHSRAPTHPSTLEMLWVRERTLTLSPSTVSTFGLAIESIKEFGGALDLVIIVQLICNTHLHMTFEWNILVCEF